MENPEPLDDCGPTIIYGVESENIEEINDAYGDMITDMGELCGNETKILIVLFEEYPDVQRKRQRR